MSESTEHLLKQVELAHQEWMAALDAVEDPIFLHDKEFRILRANRAYQRCAGIPFKQIIGRPYFDIFPKSDGPLPGCTRAQEIDKDSEEDEIVLEGRTYRSRAFPVCDESGEYLYSVHNLEDVTERKQMEQALRDEVLRRRQLMESSRDGMAVINKQHQIIEANARFAEMLGYTAEEMLDLHTWDFEAMMTEADIRTNFQDLSIISTTIETRHRRKDGSEYDVEISISGAILGEEPMAFTVCRDISERKQQELAMQRANRALRTISAGNEVLIHAVREDQLLQEMCDVAVHVGGYRMAWLGYARDDGDKSIEQMAQACMGENCPVLLPLSWDKSKRVVCAAGSAVISGKPKVVQDIQSDPEENPWRENVLQYGFASCIALPLMDGNRAFGALVLFDDKKNVFDADEVKVLEEMSGDLAFGILTLRVKAAHREHEQRLQTNMLQTVEAIASIVEMRDPYTSGHQARVADIAKEIARQMGMPEEQIQAIHLAGLVHDLGKIRIPAEILSKPSRLNDIEYSLIKMHPQAGYDILKGVDFSWPIAEMVLQHHERMDGTGYPQGLKGEEILPGARILVVADVIEAMSSHRPYRPGLGIDAAMNEIIRGRGTLYDPQVVDASVVLFRERGYVLND
ncbi:MAG: PAS domain S-box protein [Gammaproteobacteria bacterium]|nr:PAS domain S-box protein [Gammaproteobacteria bacterium]MBU1482269.1 PAS domain S-box protein [Gammaproteobacteria bacterium]